MNDRKVIAEQTYYRKDDNTKINMTVELYKKPWNATKKHVINTYGLSILKQVEDNPVIDVSEAILTESDLRKLSNAIDELLS